MFSKMKSYLKQKKEQALALAAAGLAYVGLGTTKAHAALSIDQQAAVDSIDLLIADLSTWAWAAVLTMMGLEVRT